MAAIGWYGPLIDLSMAASHIDQFVQLLVFVRRSQPVQKCITSNERALLKTNIYAGDDTRSHFPITLWQKHMGSMVAAGDIILLQNVKVVKFRDILEAATVQASSIIVLVHSDELTTLKATDNVVANSQLGETARRKLRRVIHWVQHTESTLQHVQLVGSKQKQKISIKNWKVHEEKKSWTYLSVSEVLCHTSSCNAIFCGYIGEISLPSIERPVEVAEGLLFGSKRLLMTAGNRVVEDLICTGCKLCGSPVDSRSLLEQQKFPLYCKKNKYLHEVCLIYRPFLINLWDQDGRIPVLVKNKAAEILFANITAENVYKCYQEEKIKKIHNHKHDVNWHHSIVGNSSLLKISSVGSTHGNHQPGCAKQIDSNGARKKPDFYRVWLILMKLLQQDKNSPFLFEVSFHSEKVLEDGRFELVSLKLPCNVACES